MTGRSRGIPGGGGREGREARGSVGRKRRKVCRTVAHALQVANAVVYTESLCFIQV